MWSRASDGTSCAPARATIRTQAHVATRATSRSPATARPYGAHFGRLDEPARGDLVHVTDHAGRRWTYAVADTGSSIPVRRSRCMVGPRHRPPAHRRRYGHDDADHLSPQVERGTATDRVRQTDRCAHGRRASDPTFARMRFVYCFFLGVSKFSSTPHTPLMPGWFFVCVW